MSSLFDPFCKVVTAHEMARVERRAIENGYSEKRFMEKAGEKIALAVSEWIESKKPMITLLVGKGNNGGDAYVAGIHLLKAGYSVRAIPLYPSKACSPLNQMFRSRFLRAKGKIEKELSFEGDSLLLDGLLGTGFKGKLEPPLAEAIRCANQSKKPIVAIDIPSGLNGTTGEVGECAIIAQTTIALGMAKSGFFLREGWNHVGHLKIEDFGLPRESFEEASPFAYLPSRAQLAHLLPPIARNRHKYQAGYVVGLGGSTTFKGAPKMAGLAALRAGAGVVRIFHREEIGEAPPELICQKWDEAAWQREIARSRAVFLGPGVGQSKEALFWLKKELNKIQVPCVVDAEALQKEFSFPPSALLTPHRGEMLRLLGLSTSPGEEALLDMCRAFSEERNVILVLKGAPTYLFAAGKPPLIIPYGDPGMAKAGSGDVLTGILAALLAQGMEPLEAAVLGVVLHALSGEEAAREKTSYGEIARDLIEFLPRAFQVVMRWNTL